MSYSLILSRLINTPLLLEESKMEIITTNISLKLLTNNKIDIDTSDTYTPTRPLTKDEKFLNTYKAAIIPVYDSLVSHNGAGNSGRTSYSCIANTIRNLEDIKTIFFNFKTPGGEVSGCFGLAEFIRSLSLKGIKTIGITDGICCSGGAVLMSACSETWATEDSMLGSLGAVAAIVDLTAKDEKDGIKWEFFRSRSLKAPNPHEKTTNATRLQVENDVKFVDAKMMELLQEFRPQLTLESINKLDGKHIFGKEAVAIGLVDKLIPSIDIAIDEFLSRPNNVTTSKTLFRNSNMTLEDEIVNLKAEVASVKESANQAYNKGIADERARIEGIQTAAQTFGINQAIVAKRISAGTSLSESVNFFESLKEAMQMATALPVTPSAHSSTPNLDVSTTQNYWDSLNSITD